MRKSKMLAKIRAGLPVKLGMMGHFLPSYIAHAAHFGYDAIWLELEHRAMDSREVQALLGFFHLYDIDCLLRPATREKAVLYRYLEDGATGLIIPHVESTAVARDLVNKVKFPPIGDRGIEGRGLETNYGLDILKDRGLLVPHANQETFLAIQVETPAALEQVEEFAAVEGVDAVFIGPADMAIRMPLQPEASRTAPAEVMDRVAAACQKYGKAWGSMPANLDQVKDFATRGAQLIPWQNDLAILYEGVAQRSQELDEIFAQNQK